jgi:hypothetical protein
LAAALGGAIDNTVMREGGRFQSNLIHKRARAGLEVSLKCQSIYLMLGVINKHRHL